MGRREDESTQPAPPAEQSEETPYGMGVSSEHDEGKTQEVDSREQE